MNEVLTGLNPQADDRLAADLGVRLVEGDSIEKIVDDAKKAYYALGYRAGITKAQEVSLIAAGETMTRDSREVFDAHLKVCDKLAALYEEAKTAELLTLVDQAKEAGLVS